MSWKARWAEGMLNLADRGFFSMDRWTRFSGTGAHLLLAGQEQRPVRPVQDHPDPARRIGAGPAAREQRHAQQAPPRRRRPRPARLPDTAARLICFTVLTRTRSGRTKTTAIRVLTTLLDPDLYPARELAALYTRRWQVETAFLHLKKPSAARPRPARTVGGLARQEAWALLLVHNMIAAIAAKATLPARPCARPLNHRRTVPGPLPRHR